MTVDVDLDVDDYDVGVDLADAVCVRLFNCKVIPPNFPYSLEVLWAATQGEESYAPPEYKYC